MRRLGSLSAAAAAIIVVVGCSNSESTKTDGTRRPAPEQAPPRPTAIGTGGAASDVKSDGEFVHDVALMNLAELELSRMALQKSTRPDVKTFAQTLIDDHAAAGDTLKSVVSDHSSEWPSQLDEKHRKDADDLAKKQGADFDSEYLEAIVHGHQDLTAKLESRLDLQSVEEWKTAAAGRTQSKALPNPKVDMPDVKVRPDKSNTDLGTKINQWAAETYPVAQKHLDTARALENATKNGEDAH
jgi:predicted outer membrane protein